MVQLLQTPLFIIFTSITLICVLPTLAHYWYKVRKAELEANLKQEMLQRGMSAAEIEQVLEASTDATVKRGAGRCSRE